MAVDHQVEALPQRAPRGRRHDANATAATGATLKRARDQDEDADRQRRTDTAAAAERDAAGETEVTVSWTATSEKPPGEATNGEHCYECACPGRERAQHSDSRGSTWQLVLTRCALCARLGPHGGHPAARLCVPLHTRSQPWFVLVPDTSFNAMQGLRRWRLRSGGRRWRCSTTWCAVQNSPTSVTQPHCLLSFADPAGWI